MKISLPLSLISAAILSSGIAQAQQDKFAYAVTDVNKDGASWSFLRKLDLSTGAFSDVLLNGNDATQMAFDASSKKQMTVPLKDDRYGTAANAAFGTGVAAIAYDKKNKRIYYTPMLLDQLRYIDLKTMKVFFVNGGGLTGLKIKVTDQSNIVTRMAIASDGFGYALTNDGNHLVRFSTGKNAQSIDMGALVDDPANKDVSVHNSCTSYGGDMIADDDGNLYVFSARNQVFRVNIQSKVATHLGAVNGLPTAFTINGAAVDDNNQILFSSAVDNSSLYTLNYQTMTASPSKSGPWRSSDLANSNLLATRNALPSVRDLRNPDEIADGRIQLFPNPVTNKQFTVQFGLSEGNYTVQVLDIAGRQAAQSFINIRGKGQTENIQLPQSAKTGVYLVKVVDKNNAVMFSKKVVVQ